MEINRNLAQKGISILNRISYTILPIIDDNNLLRMPTFTKHTTINDIANLPICHEVYSHLYNL